MHGTLTGFFIKYGSQYVTVFHGQIVGFSEQDPGLNCTWKMSVVFNDCSTSEDFEESNLYWQNSNQFFSRAYALISVSQSGDWKELGE